MPGSFAKQLAILFKRNGYVRWQNRRRLRRESHQSYKKGDEVRLVAETRAELRLIRRLLRRAGFRLAKPFAKGRQYRQPIYGREEVRRFLALIRQASKRGSRTEGLPRITRSPSAAARAAALSRGTRR